jgi:hypothetical protein
MTQIKYAYSENTSADQEILRERLRNFHIALLNQSLTYAKKNKKSQTPTGPGLSPHSEYA